MTEQEFIQQAIIKAKIEYAKILKAEYYTDQLKYIITDLKDNGFKLIILGNDIRVTF